MNIGDDERRYIWWAGELTADPDGATVVLEIDETQHAMTWQAAAVQSGGEWRRLARTVEAFTGTSVLPGVGDVALTAGRHVGQPILSLTDGQIIEGDLFPIDVVGPFPAAAPLPPSEAAVLAAALGVLDAEVDVLTIQVGVLSTEADAIAADVVALTTGAGVLTSGLAAEIARALAAEAANTDDVAAETVRATAAEGLLAPKASPTFTGTVAGVTKAHVGLGNVDNTSDVNKPVSTAQAAADALKADAAATTAALATKVDKGELALTPEMYGAVGDDTADDTDAILAVFAAANATRVVGVGGNIWAPGATVVMRGRYNLATLAAPVTVSCNVEGAGSAVRVPAAYAAAVLLVGHETSGSALHSATIRLPRVSKPIVTDFTAGSIGVRIQNLTHGDLTLGRVEGFETAQHYTGLGMGTAYNRVHIGWVDFCKVGLRFSPLAGGWANQNTFVGGGISQSPNFIAGSATRRAGYRHILMDEDGGWVIHANTFVGISLENDLSEFYIEAIGAIDNTWYGTRFEQGTAGRAVTTESGLLGDAPLPWLYSFVPHGLSVGNAVVFLCDVAPAGMVSGATYYMTSVDGERYSVSDTLGGANVVFTGAGTNIKVYRPPTIRWDNTAGTTFHNVIRDWNCYPGHPEVIHVGAGPLPERPAILG